MINTTILSLHVMTMTLSSPFFITNQQHSGIIRSSFYNSHFSHFFSSVFVSYATKHHSIFNQNVFSSMLSAPLSFETGETQCGIDNTDKNVIPNPLEDKTIKQEDFGMFTDRRAYYESPLCGNVNISFCIFENCFCSQKHGGSLRILSDCIVFIQATQFKGSHSSTPRGGTIYACKEATFPEYNDKNEIQINDKKLSQINLQYCCFSDCYPDKSDEMFGLALYCASEKVILYYSATINCPPTGHDVSSYGALFDIQADEINSKHINVTGGYSKMCAGLEYRGAKYGRFEFQTFSKIKQCSFATSFSDVDTGSLIIQYSNYYDITIKSGNTIGDDNNWHPALIHILFRNVDFDKNSITLNEFSFAKINEDKNTGNIPYRTARVVSRGTTWINSVSYEQIIKITFKNCVGDNSIKDLIGPETLENPSNTIEKMRIGSPVLSDNPETFDFSQLNLGQCIGVVTPPRNYDARDVYDPTDMFTFSKQFSQSEVFSETADFTNTEQFTTSGSFSNSNKFSESEYFTKSSDFTQTEKFTRSIAFSDTGKFSVSTYFTDSSDFTKSSDFNPTNKFTKTEGFTLTSGFTKTDSFSRTFYFSKSHVFSQSSNFSNSNPFTPSVGFNSTNTFTPSTTFSKSDQFTKSNGFSESGKFSETTHFSESIKFTQSSDFTKSNIFKPTGDFNSSSCFTSSGEFTKSSAFSESAKFSNSYPFSESGKFSVSRKFSQSDEFKSTSHFADSSKFTKSNCFSESMHFSSSLGFKASQIFTSSGLFSESQTIKPKSEVVVKIKIDNDNNSSKFTNLMKIGVGVGVGGVVVLAVLAGIILLRRKKMKGVEISDEKIEIFDETASTMTEHNPLIEIMSEDDPFAEEFEG